MGSRGPSIAVVTQETRLKGLMGRWATKGAARFRLRQAHAVVRQQLAEQALVLPAAAVQATESLLAEADFTKYEEEDVAYQRTLEQLRQELDLGYPVRFIDRGFLPNFDFGLCVAVVVVGRDGLVANTAKYVAPATDDEDRPLSIVAVNPDPQRIDGILLPFSVGQARRAVQRTLAGKANVREVTLAEARLNDGQAMLAFNDFFIGTASHVSARYTLRVGPRHEPQSSSGIIVSTGAGSTGWLSSIFNMAAGFARWAGTPSPEPLQLAWDDRRLVWAVREPFRSKQSGADLVAGVLAPGEEMIVESLMPSRGVIFSDGVEADYLEFNSGTIATLAASPRRARLVVG